MKIEQRTAAQRRAIEATEAQILCVAGPGSGKTTVLTDRIARLIETGTKPSRIVSLTYTNAAARNLEHRLTVGGEPGVSDPVRAALGFCGTLHGFCLRMLKQHAGIYGYGERTAVIDEDASRELIESKAKSMGCKTSIDKLMARKKDGVAKEAGANYSADELVVLAYEEELRESGLLDFDLILTEFHRLLSMGDINDEIFERFDYLFVDEVQDSATVDWQIFRSISIENKFLVGDPDQAIFGFRGGRPELMVQYARDPRTKVLWLEDNFRCREEICSAANRLIGHNPGRLEKLTVSAVGTGGRVQPFGQTLNEGDEIAQVLGYLAHVDTPPNEIAILARTNAIAAGHRDAAKAAGLPVVEAPESALPKDWPLARALIEVMAQPSNDTLAFFYIIAREVNRGSSAILARKKAHTVRQEAMSKGLTLNAVWFGIPNVITDAANQVAEWMDKEDLSSEARMLVIDMLKALPEGATLTELALEVARLERPVHDTATDGLTVTTIHAAKGREWDVVFLVGFEDEVTPGTAKSADIEEERRLAFVALTRARKAVFISHAAGRRATWGPKAIQNHKPSRFLEELT